MVVKTIRLLISYCKKQMLTFMYDTLGSSSFAELLSALSVRNTVNETNTRPENASVSFATTSYSA